MTHKGENEAFFTELELFSQKIKNNITPPVSQCCKIAQTAMDRQQKKN